jgi:phage gpG-like protein
MATYKNIEDFFTNFYPKFDTVIPQIIAETATEDFKNNFKIKSFDGVAWEETKKPVKKGSLMVRSGALVSSVRPAVVNSTLVRISAGNSKVPYAAAHNEGLTITRSSYSENFKRNRVASGKRKGKFKKGTTAGQGFTVKEYSYSMPKRQFMGRTDALNQKIKDRIAGALNN